MTARWFAIARLPLLCSTMIVCACTAPTVAELPEATRLVTQAEELERAGSYDDAILTLSPLSENACPRHLRDRRDLVLARSELGRGDPWLAFTTLETFSDLYPHSDLRGEVVQQLWQAAVQLRERNSGFLFFWSDRDAARTVLKHLITRHPDTQLLADALIILGDMAYETGDYDLAQARYRDIILNRPESAWRFKAQFRFAMSIVEALRGPDYDLSRMEHAVRELRGFLATQTEDQKMLDQARAALAMVQQWQVQRHIDVANYYKRLDNRPGQEHHLRLATQEQFAETPGYRSAIEAMERLESTIGDSPAGGQR